MHGETVKFKVTCSFLFYECMKLYKFVRTRLIQLSEIIKPLKPTINLNYI